MIQNLGAGWIRFLFEEPVDSSVFLVGDFNGWDEHCHPMEPQENGSHQAFIKLSPGEYEFKYKCGCAWFNDLGADKYVPNCWGSENSVVVVPPYREDDTMDTDSRHRPPRRKEQKSVWLQAQAEA